VRSYGWLGFGGASRVVAGVLSFYLLERFEGSALLVVVVGDLTHAVCALNKINLEIYSIFEINLSF
jgi:hypothetical protein